MRPALLLAACSVLCAAVSGCTGATSASPAIPTSPDTGTPTPIEAGTDAPTDVIVDSATEADVRVDAGPVGPPRPMANTGTGFYVVGNKIYDANGVELIIRGFNNRHTTNMGESVEVIANNVLAIDDFPSTKANAVRVMIELIPDPTVIGQTSQEAQAIVEHYIAKKLVPIVVDHYGTHHPDLASLQMVAAGWVKNASWLKQYERQVILNIANEWGDAYSATSTEWRDGNIAAIKVLRAAGINNLLVIDAGGSGGDLSTITNWGAAVLASDPQANIAFSIHMYANFSTPDTTYTTGHPSDIQTALTSFQSSSSSKDLALLVGEFSTDEAGVGGAHYVCYKTTTAIGIFDAMHIGAMAWVWSTNSDPIMDLARDVRTDAGVTYGWQYKTDADLSTFGQLIVDDPVLGLKATSVPSTIFP